MKETKPTTPKDIAEPVKFTTAFITLLPVASPKVSHIHSERTEINGSKTPKAERKAERNVMQGTMAISVE